MSFTKTFNEKDKQLALNHRSEMSKYYRLFMHCLDKGELKKSEMYFNHFLSLKREIDRMQKEKQVVDQGYFELSDREIRKRRDWF